jgi:monofunctional biosynthetic peptidoglycan transglycosylase
MRPLLRWTVLALVVLLALQLYFAARVAMMATIAPQSTTFERSEAWRILNEKGLPSTKRRTGLRWHQQWVDYKDISEHLKRAVIASEDDSFAWHEGVDWEAVEKALQANALAEANVGWKIANGSKVAKPPKIVGGSTITQQLAKNLFLSGERTFLRKGQEFVLTYLLEMLLSKQRILELYLNHVEWGEGVFGAEAAAQHYYRKSAARLSPQEAARLAVMLPRPKYYEKLPESGYLAERAAVIVDRLPKAELP